MKNMHIDRVRAGKNKSFVQLAVSMYAFDHGVYDAGDTIDDVREQLVSVWESHVESMEEFVTSQESKLKRLNKMSLSSFKARFRKHYHPEVCEGIMQKEKKRKGDIHDNLNDMIAQAKEWDPPYSGDMKTWIIFALEAAKPLPYEDEEPPYADASELRAAELKDAEDKVVYAHDKLSEAREEAATKTRQFDAFAESLIAYEFNKVNK